MKNIFRDKTILITGGTGSIGSQIVRQIIKMKPRLVKIFARDEYNHWLLEKELEEKYPRKLFKHIVGDIQNLERLDYAMRGVNIVIHAAGLKHIPFAEQNPEEAISINVLGSKNLLQTAIRHNVERVIAISTDKTVDPTSIMGISKLLMERLFIADRNADGVTTKFAVVRFGNVMNSRGSVIPRWIEQVKSGKPISVTDKKMQRFFMSVEDAVSLVLLACQIMRGREIIVLKMAEVNMFELANKIVKEHGGNGKIKIICTGMRDREKLRENLMTEEEKKLLIEKGEYYIILPNKTLLDQRKKLYGK